MKSLAFRLSLLVGVLMVGGCAVVVRVPPQEKFTSRHGFNVWGNVTKEQAEELDKMLDKMEPKVVAAIRDIEVSSVHSRCENCSAYCTPQGDILLLDTSVNDADTVWHEAAHAYHFKRGCRHSKFYTCSCSFCTEWLKVAGDVYTNDENKRHGKAWDYPAHGMLTQYSSKSYFEDVAEMTSDAYCYKTAKASRFYNLKLFEKIHSDPRYEKKLKLLAKYGFISQKLCDEILKP